MDKETKKQADGKGGQNEPLIMCAPIEHCICGDVGFFVGSDYDGTPTQEQCEFCYTVPWSAFNVNSIKTAYKNNGKS